MHLQALLDRCLCFNLRNCLELWIFSWGYVSLAPRQLFDLLLNVGGSLDVRLGRHAMVGLSASTSASLAATNGSSGFESLLGGLQVGYGW